MGLEGLARVAIGVFEAIEVVLEGAVVCGDECPIAATWAGPQPPSQPWVSLRAKAQCMIPRLSSSTRPSGRTSTGTVPLAEASSSSGGLACRCTSRRSRFTPGRKPAAASASRARIA